MRHITVDKSWLQEIIEQNRHAHYEQFVKINEAYRKAARAELLERVREIESGKDFNLYFKLQAPEDHTEDYDLALEMLDHEISNEVSISNQDYSRYVKDNWEWKSQFEFVSSTYLNG